MSSSSHLEPDVQRWACCAGQGSYGSFKGCTQCHIWRGHELGWQAGWATSSTFRLVWCLAALAPREGISDTLPFQHLLFWCYSLSSKMFGLFSDLRLNYLNAISAFHCKSQFLCLRIQIRFKRSCKLKTEASISPCLPPFCNNEMRCTMMQLKLWTIQTLSYRCNYYELLIKVFVASSFIVFHHAHIVGWPSIIMISGHLIVTWVFLCIHVLVSMPSRAVRV